MNRWRSAVVGWHLPSAAAPAAASWPTSSLIHHAAQNQRAAAIQLLIPGIRSICHCFRLIFPFRAAALLRSSFSSSWLQPAQQNPLSKITTSSRSFACFLTSGRLQAQGEISHTQTHRQPRAHQVMRTRGRFGIRHTGQTILLIKQIESLLAKTAKACLLWAELDLNEL